MMPPDALHVIGDETRPDAPVPEALSGDDLIKIFSWIVVLRAFDERAVMLQRQGRLGTYPAFWGEEATQAGPLYACRATDWVFPSYRQGAIGILRGLDPATIFKYRRGHGGRHGFWNPREIRVGPSIVSIATHIPHAAGLAWAAKIRGDDVVSLAWFGDGATSEGDFHEGLNLAAVTRAPTVFFCTNNQWAISTPYSRQTATPTIAEKAVAYGIPSIRVDGFDPFACWKAAQDAIDRARQGEGPTLIEAVAWRIGPHATADDPGRYRDETVSERWRQLEPLGRTARFLRRLGVLDDEGEASIRLDAQSRIDDAVRHMEAVGDDPDIMFETLYSSGHPAIDRLREG
jgi:pyruvate dehydrogenase E1 component subunit alpha